MLRISQTKQFVDPITGRKRLEDTDLVKRARAAGISEQDLLQMAAWTGPLISSRPYQGQGQPPEDLLAALAEVDPTFANPDFRQKVRTASQSIAGAHRTSRELSKRDLLEFAKVDIFNDICGRLPLSGLNYIWVTAVLMMHFVSIEKELRRRRNPVYVRVYETGPGPLKEKRGGLTTVALEEQDDECLRVMAEKLQEPIRAGFMNHIYWKDLGSIAELHEKRSNAAEMEEGIEADACSVM
ncbi:hypothetical protein VTK56DRAFT_5038 [Thermocarpiscus australiensis]